MLSIPSQCLGNWGTELVSCSLPCTGRQCLDNTDKGHQDATRHLYPLLFPLLARAVGHPGRVGRLFHLHPVLLWRRQTVGSPRQHAVCAWSFRRVRGSDRGGLFWPCPEALKTERWWLHTPFLRFLTAFIFSWGEGAKRVMFQEVYLWVWVCACMHVCVWVCGWLLWQHLWVALKKIFFHDNMKLQDK